MPVNVAVTIESPSKRPALFGPTDRNLRQLREIFGISVVPRGDEIRLSGPAEAVDRAAEVIGKWQTLLRNREYLTPDDISKSFDSVKMNDEPGGIDVFTRGGVVHAKTAGQQRYIDAMFANDLTFCVGPAGSGKTYLAVAAAASLLKQGRVRRLILARPAVEAGERLGFLPGDLAAKVNPYLRPLFDALHDMMDGEQTKRLMFNDVIEVIPLAFMRGRTFNESVIILDEAQNTTVSQMLMVLTRMGHGSKMIVTGDTSQTDLPPDTQSGLSDALDRLAGIKGIASVQLAKADIVRHRLVQNIVMAYEGENDVDRS